METHRHLYMKAPALLLGAALLLALVCRFTSESLWDDSYFFVRYSRNLSASGEPSFDPGGGRAFGITSPMHLLVVHLLREAVVEAAVPALLLSSASAGLLLLLLTWRVARLRCRHRSLLALMLLLSSALASGIIGVHMTSGMDTMLAMASVALLIILFDRAMRGRGTGAPVAAGVWAGLCLSVRPDLLVLSLGLPLFALILADGRRERRVALTVGGAALLTVAGLMTAFRWFFGWWLPLSCLVKLPGFYGGLMARAGLLHSVAEVGRLLAGYPLLFALPVAGLAIRRVGASAKLPLTDRALVPAGILHLLLVSTMVTQIMGGSCRFQQPVVPVLVLLSAGSLQRLVDSADVPGGLGSVPSLATGLRVLFLVLAAVIALASMQLSLGFARRSESGPFCMSLHREYESRWTGYWKGLDAVSRMPGDLVIAGTELGLPSVMNPDKRILDLSGLNEPSIALGEETQLEALRRVEPDLVYMPHPDYESMIRSIRSSGWFDGRYLYLPGDSIGAALSVALRRDGPCFEALLEAML